MSGRLIQLTAATLFFGLFWAGKGLEAVCLYLFSYGRTQNVVILLIFNLKFLIIFK